MIPDSKKPKDQSKWFLREVDPTREWMVAIDPVPFVIGRDEDCNLRLQSKWVSRHHAEIRRNGDHFWIHDLGSTNGVIVNQKQIQTAELLEPGDIITIGKSEFRVKSVSSPSVAPSDQSDDTYALDDSSDVIYMASLEPRLRELLLERSVIPHFQPILSFADMQIVGYEILGRIGASDLPPNPADLFDVAVYLGLASDLSALFREVGVKEGTSLPGSPLLFVNINPVEMDQMSHLLTSLEKIRNIAPSSKIVIEIHEKAITNTQEMFRLRNTLRKLDIGMAFDDFGVGQTRLIELAEVPPDFLKFDISLIHQVHLAPKRLHQMIMTFVKAVKDLGIATLAEGIECPEEAQMCKELGFDYAQGYLYGRPLPIAEINSLG